MPEVDTEDLLKILRQLLQVTQELRGFIPATSKTSDVVPKLPAGPPGGGIYFPHTPDTIKSCLYCGISNHKPDVYKACVVFFPCKHCVCCTACWKEFYAAPGNGGVSALVRLGAPPCKACRTKVTHGKGLVSLENTKEWNSVKFKEKNEYLGDGNALV